MSYWRTLQKDPLVWIAAAVFAAVLAPYFLPILDTDAMAAYVVWYADIPLLLVTMFVFQSGLRDIEQATERRFWHLWTLALGLWLIVRLMRVAVPVDVPTPGMDLTGDVLYLLFYLCIVLALGLDFKQSAEGAKAARKNQVRTAGLIIFLFGMLTYFALIPIGLSREEYGTVVPSMLLYLVMDTYVVIRVGFVFRGCTDMRSRTIYGWIGLTALLWLATDVVECLQWMEVVPWNVPGEFWDLAWLTPFVTLTVAARVRAHDFSDAATGRLSAGRVPGAEDLMRRTPWGGPLVAYAVAFPILHFTLYAFSVLDPASRSAREIVALLFLAVLLVAAYWYERLLEGEIEELDESRQRAERLHSLLATAIDQATETIAITDAGGRVEYVNPAFEAALGIDHTDIIGQHADFLEDGVWLRGSSEDLWKAVRSGEVWAGHFTYTTDDGEIFEGEGSVSPVRDESREIVQFVLVLRDVRSEKRLERQLAQASKMEALGTLAGGVAHDFNNILHAIFGYTELSLQEVPADSKVARDLGVIKQSAERAKNLVSQILTFSRGEPEEERRPTDMYHAVRESLSMLKVTIPSTIELKHDLDEAAGTVIADPNQIQRVILSLASNAAQSMAGGCGELEISLSSAEVDVSQAAELDGLSAGPYVRLSVKDDGCGMDEETVAKVFDPFFTTKEVGEGTGLGLSVAHGIVTGLEGAIQLESSPGKGTTFTLYFPRQERQVDLSQEESPRPGAGPDGGGERVLVVDDELALIELMTAALEQLGYSVTSFGDSLEALQAFMDDPDSFDAVITDQTMPRCTGLELAERIRAVRRDIPIILATGFNQSVTPERTESIGINTVLVKPYRMVKLADSLRQVLDSGV